MCSCSQLNAILLIVLLQISSNTFNIWCSSGIQSDGSMHGFVKEWHPGSLSDFEQNIDVEISTPIYPTTDGTLLKILKVYPWVEITSQC